MTFNPLTLALCLVSLTSGCAGQYRAQKSTDWYVGQGTKLDDCGPASAAMAVNWAGGHSNLRYAKAVTRPTGWWMFEDIQKHLSQQNLRSGFLPLNTLAYVLKKGDGAILRTAVLGVPHFVFVSSYDGETVLVADPLQGNKRVSLKQVQKMPVDNVVIAIRNDPENPLSQFDIRKLPWFKSAKVY